MGLGLTRTYTGYGIPVWQNTPELLQGGMKLVTTGLVADSVLPAGTPISASETTRLATVLKTAIAQANATNSATDYKVLKGHHFAVGNYLAVAVGGKAYAITAITTTETAYDTISVGTTLGVAVTAGDILFKSSAEGATAAALDVTPNGLLYEAVKVEANTSVGVAYKGRVYQRRIPGIPTAVVTALKHIFFSQSY